MITEEQSKELAKIVKELSEELIIRNLEESDLIDNGKLIDEEEK